MKALISFCALGLALGISTVKADEPKSGDNKSGSVTAAAGTNSVAVIKTSEGEMVFEFWSDVAPKTVENFKTLAKKGFYDGTCFHRIIDGFMIQGGDPLTKDPNKESAWGAGGPGYTIQGETNTRSDRRHVRGVLSMANSGSPDTAGSQFFICLASLPQLDGGYTTFGKLIKGDDVLTRLGKTPVKPNPYDPRQELSRPIKRVGLISIKIVPANPIK
jgi:peptidyl-prolyl cis-trans isomerase B (cyclophilin B)